MALNRSLQHARNICPTYHYLKRTNKYTPPERIPGLVQTDGDGIWGNAGEERRATNVGGEDGNHYFVTPRVLHTPDALNGVEALGKSRVRLNVHEAR